MKRGEQIDRTFKRLFRSRHRSDEQRRAKRQHHRALRRVPVHAPAPLANRYSGWLS